MSLYSSDLQQLAELSQELQMETEDSEVIIESHSDNIDMEEEIVATEIGAEEIEIESERAPSPEEILPDLRIIKSSVPPLRPLTIAPKPTKVPVTFKSVSSAPQQLLLLQGSGPHQTIKLLSSHGQELNLANLSLGKPVPIKPATVKNMVNQGISLMPQKQVIMKKVVGPGQKTFMKSTPHMTFSSKQGTFVVVQKSESSGTPVKLVQSGNAAGLTQITPTKTLTVQQAQEMGILSNAKLIPQAQSTPKHAMLLNKGQKTIKLVPQVTPAHIMTSVGGSVVKTISVNQLKSPTKILPAGKLPQHVIYKKAGGNQTIIPSGQIIQVSGSQSLGSGQLHQINIPGKGMQYIKFVPATSVATLSTATSTTAANKNATNTGSSHPANIVLTGLQPTSLASNVVSKSLKPVVVSKPLPLNTQVVMLPSYLATAQQQQQQHLHQQPVLPKIPIPKQPVTPRLTSRDKEIEEPKPSTSSSSTSTSEAAGLDGGMRPRKPCNCTKSQCLKLYCDCFANGEFCYMCNCMTCYNNLENEENRQRAIKACLERNPNAFKPKIGKAKDMAGDMSIRKHTKGCNCKRSWCLKNYCECYEAKIACSSNCKCVGCRNIEDSLEKKNFRADSLNNGVTIVPIEKIAPKLNTPYRSRNTFVNSNRQAISFITDDVIEATCQCLLSIAENATENMEDVEMTKGKIIEEFGRCLTEIIQCSSGSSRNLN